MACQVSPDARNERADAPIERRPHDTSFETWPNSHAERGLDLLDLHTSHAEVGALLLESDIEERRGRRLEGADQVDLLAQGDEDVVDVVLKAQGSPWPGAWP